jgi:hypothetical protein
MLSDDHEFFQHFIWLLGENASHFNIFQIQKWSLATTRDYNYIQNWKKKHTS